MGRSWSTEGLAWISLSLFYPAVLFSPGGVPCGDMLEVLFFISLTTADRTSLLVVNLFRAWNSTCRFVSQCGLSGSLITTYYVNEYRLPS